MAANTTIHSIDANNNECIVTLYDGNDLILDQVNIGIDVAGNTAYINSVLKTHLLTHRREKIRKNARIV